MFSILFLVLALFQCTRADFADSENSDSYLLNSLLEERAAMSCEEEGWIRFRGGRKCYFLGGSKESWGAAERKCREYGGYLVNINGKKERNDLQKYLVKESSVWVGAAAPWNGILSNCLSLSSEGISEWNNRYCAKRLKYVCEKRI